jgi:hypothetical protein
MARFSDPDEFLRALKLDPTQWSISGVPTPKPDKDGVTVDPNSLVQPGKTSQGTPTAAPGRASVDWQLTLLGPNGEVRTVTMRPQGQGVNAANVGLDQLDWNVTGVEQGVKPNDKDQSTTAAAVAASQAATAKANQDLKDLQDTAANRQKNVDSRGLNMTDQEIATMDATLKSQGLTQQQIDAQLKIASDNNKNSQTANDIALVNAKTNAQVAASNQAINEARIKIEQAGSDQAAIKLAQDEAMNVANREHLNIADAQNQQRIDTERLTQQQANQIAQGTLSVNQQNAASTAASNVEAARHNQAVEAQTAAAAQATADSQTQTNAITAANNLLTNARSQATQGAQAGAQLLSTRAAQATGALSNLMGSALGNKNFGAAGGIPSDLGANLVQGLAGWTAELSGGQATLDAAARMVAAADPTSNAADPVTQKAIATLSLLLDKWSAATGQKVTGGPTTAAGAGGAVSAPLTGTTPFNPQASTAAMNTAGFQDTPAGRLAASQANPALLAPVRSAQPSMGAQGAQGAININISGGGPASSPNPWTAYGSAYPGVGAGMPATGQVVGSNTGAPWGVPGGFTAPAMSPTPPQPFMAPQTVGMPVAA